MSLTLNQLKPDQEARVVQVNGEREQRLKFLDMGFTPRTKISVRKIAPMGDPMEVSLRGYVVSLRKDEAAHICVELGDE